LNPQISQLIRTKAHKMKEFFFNQLQKFFFIQKIIKAKSDEKSFNLIQKAFISWKKSLNLIKANRKNHEKHERRLLVISMVYWKQYMQLQRKYRNYQKKALIFKGKLVKSRFLRLWVKNYQVFNYPVNEMKEFMRKAEIFYRKSRKNLVFKLLSNYCRKIALPMKKNKAKSHVFHMKSLRNSAFSHWKSLLLLRKSQEKSILAYRKIKTRSSLSKILNDWRLFARFSHIKALKIKKLTIWFTISRFYKTWKKAFSAIKRHKEIEVMIIRTFKRKSILKAFKVLKKNKYSKKRLRKTNEFFKRKREDSYRKRVFQAIRVILKMKRVKFLKVIIRKFLLKSLK